MAATYDLGTDIGRVRLLCRDTDIKDPLFSDEEIQAYLDMEGGVVKLAAAQALEDIASSHSLILKVTSVLGLSVNGVQVAQDLRNRAGKLRWQVNQESDFEIVSLEVFP